MDLRPNLVSFWGRTNRGEQEEEGKEKKKKKKKEEEETKLRYGTMTISMDLWILVWKVWILVWISIIFGYGFMFVGCGL